MSNVDFIDSIKIVPNVEKEILLKLQYELEKKPISLENILMITKKLSKHQKQQLELLYKEQIEKINANTDNYKNKILKIKSRITKKVTG